MIILGFTTEATEDTEFFSLFPQVKQSDTYDYKYVRLFVTKNNKPLCPSVSSVVKYKLSLIKQPIHCFFIPGKPGITHFRFCSRESQHLQIAFG